MITGHTTVIAHIGYPTHSFKSPVIYNPWFEAKGIDAVVVPMGVKAEEFEAFLPLVTKMSNFGGALITMPHKVTTPSVRFLRWWPKACRTPPLPVACSSARAPSPSTSLRSFRS